MQFLLHGLHIALIVLGGAGVLWLLVPVRRRLRQHDRAVAELRAAAAGGSVVDLAYARALAALQAGAADTGEREDATPRHTHAVRLLRAYSFAAVTTTLALLTDRIVGGPVPSPVGVSAVLVLMLPAGVLLFARPRPSRVVITFAAAAQLAAHAVVVGSVAVAAVVAGRAASTSWADLLICHTAGHRPTAAQVQAASAGLGLPSHPPAVGSGSFVSLTGSLVLAGVVVIAAISAELLNASAPRTTARRTCAARPPGAPLAASLAVAAGAAS